jgi:hypothetical protein
MISPWNISLQFFLAYGILFGAYLNSLFLRAKGDRLGFLLILLIISALTCWEILLLKDLGLLVIASCTELAVLAALLISLLKIRALWSAFLRTLFLLIPLSAGYSALEFLHREPLLLSGLLVGLAFSLTFEPGEQR